MHPSTQSIITLLRRLKGRDIGAMQPATADAFRAAAADEFTGATAGFHEVLLGDLHEGDRWMWGVDRLWEQGGFPNNIAEMLLADTTEIDASTGRPQIIQRAIARWPSFRMSLAIFGEFHYPGGGGFQAEPSLQLSLTVHGGNELYCIQRYLEVTSADFPQSGDGLTVEIWPLENCCSGGRLRIRKIKHVKPVAMLATA